MIIRLMVLHFFCFVLQWATPDIMEGLTALVKEKEKEKEKEREKDREREKEKEKEKEKEGEMEAALYTNCLLLGLDASILGLGPGTRAGLFRYSNPRVGEFLLHFLLCALRGPQLSSKVCASFKECCCCNIFCGVSQVQASDSVRCKC